MKHTCVDRRDYFWARQTELEKDKNVAQDKNLAEPPRQLQGTIRLVVTVQTNKVSWSFSNIVKNSLYV